MTEKPRPAWELEQEARAVNATDWEPMPGMAKRQCPECHYFFAVLEAVAEAEAASRCPDCTIPPAWDGWRGR